MATGFLASFWHRAATAATTITISCAGWAASEPSAPETALNQPWPPSPEDKIVNISGNFPHLTVFNQYGECGIGAVMPWAGKVWFMTYPPHFPEGSNDKLYTVDENLKLEIRPESVGGTHANRFLHDESRQMIIGPHFIDAQGKVRTADVHQLRARLTATMRHLTDPTNKVYFFGMERELYEVDVHSLAVKRIYGEMGGPFPGYHGKGAYTGSGRIVVANNGEKGWSITRDRFETPAGCLAESTGQDWKADWAVLERKNFCEVTGPGGLNGYAAGDERAWATGWDKRSVLLKLFEAGQWHTFRLPKASYSHDAFHGWYTEWPRIRQLGSSTTLMHMHGMFYFFPQGFSQADTSGIRPISSYLKMPVDYCWWHDQIVMARDDASVMQNELAGQSHSSLWFGQLIDLAQYGAASGWGGPWVNDVVKSNTPSEPFLTTGFKRGTLHLKHDSAEPVKFTIEADAMGTGKWKKLANVSVPARGYAWWLCPAELSANWLRLSTDRDATGVTAYFHLTKPPVKTNAKLLPALADIGTTGPISDGFIKPAQGDARTLLFAANTITSRKAKEAGLYRMGGALKLERADLPDKEKILRTKYGVSKADFSTDAASVIVTEGTNRFRLPKSHAAYDQAFASGWPRGKREVVTERFLFNAHGTFYELPRADAGGFRRMRPVTTHNKQISDFCRWRGMLVLAGTSTEAKPDEHFYRSEDGKAGLWFGDVDDLWRLGAPRGVGGPWKNTAVTADAPSDPYLMAGYDQKTLELSHDAKESVTFKVEVDFLADGSWSEYGQFPVPAGQTFKHVFPEGYSAHWVRLRADRATQATAAFTYSSP